MGAPHVKVLASNVVLNLHWMQVQAGLARGVLLSRAMLQDAVDQRFMLCKLLLTHGYNWRSRLAHNCPRSLPCVLSIRPCFQITLTVRTRAQHICFDLVVVRQLLNTCAFILWILVFSSTTACRRCRKVCGPMQSYLPLSCARRWLPCS